jgi:catechol 2,3-dioxygenase
VSSGAPRDPEELAVTAQPVHGEIPAATSLGEVHLTVADLDRSIEYYRTQIGLDVVERGTDRVGVGVGSTVLLVLVEEPGARPSVGHTGLYHFALLVPERADLARWLAHAAADQVGLTGMSDHFVSEALYLTDPDGHGIEIYWDRPRSVWEGQVAERMTSLPLDVQSLLAAVEQPLGGYPGLPSATVMGHVHLRVADIERTIAFYRDVLGFALMAQLGRQAAFLSAGGYHHHIGANTWESAGATPAPAHTAALRHATLRLPDPADRDQLLDRLTGAGMSAAPSADGPVIRDPSGNGWLITA